MSEIVNPIDAVSTAKLPVVLTIAGSDCSAGAGIQADLKTFAATGSYGCSVITAITAQNTLGVLAVHSLPPLVVEQQLSAIFTDFNVVAVKIGMLDNLATVKLVVESLQKFKPKHVIIDPVMLSTSGKQLLSHEAIAYSCTHLYPLATLLTPNRPELAKILGLTEVSESLFNELNAIRSIGSKYVLVKGGHSNDPDMCVDFLIGQSDILVLEAKRIQSDNTHGTGCTLSSALASYLAQGNDVNQAARMAKDYLSLAILMAKGQQYGSGNGPLSHFSSCEP